MGDLSFNYSFKVPDQMDNVCEIATSIIFTEDITKVIKETYTDNLIYEIDLRDVKETLELMTYESCKITLQGKNLCERYEKSKELVII